MKAKKKLTNGQLVDVVLAARDRIADRWTAGALARKAPVQGPKTSRVARTIGASVNPTDPEAEAWCMVGALRVEAPRGWKHDIRDVVQEAFDQADILRHPLSQMTRRIESFNDGGTQERAVGAFDELARWLKDTGWEPSVDEFMPLDDRSGINEH